MMRIRRAVASDLPAVHFVLRSAAVALHRRGLDQWPTGSPNLQPRALATQIGRGEFWIVRDYDDGPAAAVIAISQTGDPDFWTEAELAEPAVYLSKAAVRPYFAGQGLGAMLFRWAADYAWQMGMTWVRLDAWSTNTRLHGYYRAQGWTFLRNDPPPGRRSGALFERPAEPDPEARGAFTMPARPELRQAES
jgi:ribosomal protein S18 acetylase RimI-like enzyme